MTVGAMVLLPSARARGWVKVKLAKHLFEHRYDYRTEWLRFTETLGRDGPDAPRCERIVKAFADVVDAPGGLCWSATAAPARHRRQLELARRLPSADGLARVGSAWHEIEESGPYRRVRGASPRLGKCAPTGYSRFPTGWSRRLRSGPVFRSFISSGWWASSSSRRPNIRRPLDWEDFDLLRTAGNQAASSLAEAMGQEALANAQRFEEFNRRFAFILHDIKNLVSQLSLLARNAERHADNPDFSADMIATLQSSVGKMNDLLARLSPRLRRAFSASSLSRFADPHPGDRDQAP